MTTSARQSSIDPTSIQFEHLRVLKEARDKEYITEEQYVRSVEDTLTRFGILSLIRGVELSFIDRRDATDASADRRDAPVV